MTRSEIRKLLEARGIRLTKSLGQSFLHEAHYLDRIVAAAEVSRSDRVLEIGPGLGPLTERLMAQGDQILAIEKDARLVALLEERFRVGREPSPFSMPRWPSTNVSDSGASEKIEPRPGLHLIRADALAWLKDAPRDWSDWKVVSNLPYSVASPILVELCTGRHSPKRMVVTLQYEVAQRLMSKPGTKDYGVLTLLVQQDFIPVTWFKIPSSSFFPPPEVDSACLVLDRRPDLLLSEEQRSPFVRIVKRAFSQRRKMMLKLLKQDWRPEALEAAYGRTGLSPTVRAEAVSLDQFVELTRTLTAPPSTAA